MELVNLVHIMDDIEKNLIINILLEYGLDKNDAKNKHPNYKFIKADITNKSKIKTKIIEIVKKEKCIDVIINTAAVSIFSKYDKRTDLEINKTFFEVVMARGFDAKALGVLKKKKNMRVVDISNFKNNNKLTTKIFGNSFLLQDKDNDVFDRKKLKFVTKSKPTNNELKEIEFAYRICKFVKSNAIVITKDQATIGIGAGQQNRLDSCKIATQKAKKFQPKRLKNSIAASDAFFPFADGIKTLINSGVKIIVQPGGSIRDQEVINAADKAKIKMVFTGIRHFNH